jgi:hypothetical protein
MGYRNFGKTTNAIGTTNQDAPELVLHSHFSLSQAYTSPHILLDFPLLAAGDKSTYEATPPPPRQRQGEFSGRHVHLT